MLIPIRANSITNFPILETGQRRMIDFARAAQKIENAMGAGQLIDETILDELHREGDGISR